MKQIIQKKIIRTVTLWMLVMTMGLSMTGCGPKSSFGSQTLDIDYVGSDGEVTEEEVSAKSENPMEWLKKKLTGDKKNAGVNGRENVAGYTEDTTVQDLAKLSTPIAFMILGGDLDFSKVRGNLKVASVVLTIKLVILPLIMIPMIVMMGYRDADLLSGLLAYQTPVAVSSYIMAQQAGADGQLAGQLVVFSSVLSIFTLFVTILILRTIGLLGI